jgi:hypothetical protein
MCNIDEGCSHVDGATCRSISKSPQGVKAQQQLASAFSRPSGKGYPTPSLCLAEWMTLT